MNQYRDDGKIETTGHRNFPFPMLALSYGLYLGSATNNGSVYAALK
jgi:hypothetical protein